MKIILATPPEFRKLTTPAQIMGPPIGLMYLASCLKASNSRLKEKYDVAVYDAFTLGHCKEEFIRYVRNEKPDVLGLSITSRMFPTTISTLNVVRQQVPQTKIVLGGIHPTFWAADIVKEFPFVDFVIKGEAERSFPKLIECLLGLADYNSVEGLTCLVGSRLLDNPPETIRDLDSIPFPDRSCAGNVRYGYTWNGIDLTYGKFTSILTSRGCPYSCNFCTNWIFSNRKWRVRSVDNVLEELELIANQGYKSCVIIDDIFTLDPKRVKELCKGIVEKRIKLVFYCEGRVNSQDPEMFKAMKQAGFSSILFGIESGSQKVLKYLQKGTTPALARTAVKNARAAGLKTIGTFIVGTPVETASDFDETLKHIRELGLDGLDVNALSVAPWGQRYQMLLAEGKVGKNDWLTDHPISDYYNELSKQQIVQRIEEAYFSFFRIGRRKNAGRLMRYFIRDKDTRNAIVRNVLNKHLWQLVREGGRPRHKIEELTQSGSELLSEVWKARNIEKIEPNLITIGNSIDDQTHL